MSEQDGKKGSNRPIDRVQDGALRVSIFRNQTERGEQFNMVPGRIYTEQKSGQVRETTSLSGSEPLRMAHLLTKAHDRVSELRQQSKSAERNQGKRDQGYER
jgi:hypothetical protein